jgi:hypothetical protein
MHRVTGPSKEKAHLFSAAARRSARLPDNEPRLAQTQKQSNPKFSTRRSASAARMNAPRDWPKRKKQSHSKFVRPGGECCPG